MFGRALSRLYASLLKLYPSRFRDEFGKEMGEVFDQVLGGLETAGIPTARRMVEMSRFYLREIWHFPSSYLDARRFQQSFAAGDVPSGTSSYVEEDMVKNWVGQGASWGAALLGAFPFLLFGLVYLLKGFTELNGYYSLMFNYIVRADVALTYIPKFIRYAPIAVYLVATIGFLYGWRRGFPRWSYSYLGMAVYFGWYYSNGRFYGVVYGWQAWIPLITVISLGILITHSRRPQKWLFQGIWNDWTRLSFALYAFAVPMFTIIFFDDDWGVPQLYGLLFDTLLLAAGAIVFLRSRTIWERILSLQAVVLILVVKGILLGGWFDIFDRDLHALIWSLFFIIFIYFGFLLLPGVISLLQRGINIISAR